MDTRLFSFGSTSTGIVWFRVLMDRDRLEAWTTPEVNYRTYVFPGSFPPRSETEIISIGPSQITWRLAFDSLDDYWAMLAKLGTASTLTVPDKTQSHRGPYTEIHGRGYVRLSNTLLLELNADSPDPDGTIEAVATFQRHIDPVTGEVVGR